MSDLAERIADAVSGWREPLTRKADAAIIRRVLAEHDAKRDAAERELLQSANEGAWFLNVLGGKESAQRIRAALAAYREVAT